MHDPFLEALFISGLVPPLQYTHAGVVGPMAHGHVNVGPEHMPLGPDDHLLHLQRLADRGERDES